MVSTYLWQSSNSTRNDQIERQWRSAPRALQALNSSKFGEWHMSHNFFTKINRDKLSCKHVWLLFVYFIITLPFLPKLIFICNFSPLLIVTKRIVMPAVPAGRSKQWPNLFFPAVNIMHKCGPCFSVPQCKIVRGRQVWT